MIGLTKYSGRQLNCDGGGTDVHEHNDVILPFLYDTVGSALILPARE